MPLTPVCPNLAYHDCSTSFYTRHYRSPTGKESQKWLLAQVQAIADSNKSLGIKVSEFPHPWGQNSIIAHFPRNEKATGKDQRVIVAAHQDSTNVRMRLLINQPCLMRNLPYTNSFFHSLLHLERTMMEVERLQCWKSCMPW